MRPEELAKTLDHTVLRARATREDIEQACADARESHFATVCSFPVFLPLMVERLRTSDVKVCTVVSYPYGADQPEEFGTFVIDFPYYGTLYKKHFHFSFSYTEANVLSSPNVITIIGSGQAYETSPIQEISLDTGNVLAFKEGSRFSLYGIA